MRYISGLGCSGPEKRSLVKGPQKKSIAPRSKKMTNIDAILWQLSAKTEKITVREKTGEVQIRRNLHVF